MSRVVLDYSFETVRAKVDSVDRELKQLKQEKTITFGPGARAALGEGEPEDAAE